MMMIIMIAASLRANLGVNYLRSPTGRTCRPTYRKNRALKMQERTMADREKNSMENDGRDVGRLRPGFAGNG